MDDISLKSYLDNGDSGKFGSPTSMSDMEISPPSSYDNSSKKRKWDSDFDKHTSMKHQMNPPENTSNIVQKKRARHKSAKRQQTRNLQRRMLSNFLATTGKTTLGAYWFELSSKSCDIFPSLTQKIECHQGPPKPSAYDIKVAQKIARHNFVGVNKRGKTVATNRKDVVALIEYIEMNSLTPEEKDNLQFLSKFAYQSKKQSGPVETTSNSWGGRKWKIGWRKSMKCNGNIERYADHHNIQQNQSQHEEVIASHKKVSRIIGNMLKEMHASTFEQNHDSMMKNQIPSFSSLNAHDPLSEFDFTPNLTFTSDGYFDIPHLARDHSQLKFALFIPQNKHDGSLADPTAEFDLFDGILAFPCYRFGIDLAKYGGIVKVLWDANKHPHCSLPEDENLSYTRLAITAQIDAKLFNACHNNLKNCCDPVETEETLEPEQDEYLDALAQILYSSSP